MTDMFRLEDPDVLSSEILEDNGGGFGLFVTSARGAEICITENEMRAALAKIAEMKGDMLQ